MMDLNRRVGEGLFSFSFPNEHQEEQQSDFQVGQIKRLQTMRPARQFWAKKSSHDVRRGMLLEREEGGTTRDLTTTINSTTASTNNKRVAKCRRGIILRDKIKATDNNDGMHKFAPLLFSPSSSSSDAHSKDAASDFKLKSAKNRPNNYKRPANCFLYYKKTTTTSIIEGLFARSSLLLVALLALALAFSSLSFVAEAIKLQPEGKEKFYWSGEQFVITCQNNNNIKNVKFRWLGPNNADITDHRWERVHAESAGPHGHRLVVMNATANVDDGTYRCQLGSTDDRLPRETTEFQLKLFKKTSFKETPKRLVLAEGSKGVLSCQVEFDPNVFQPTVSWHRDGRPIEMFNESIYSVTEYEPSRQLSQLTIRPLTRRHEGVYSCRADAITSHLSKISEHEIQLEVTYAPTFELPSPQTIWVERSAAGRRPHPAEAGPPGGHLGVGSSYHKHGRLRATAYGAGSSRRGQSLGSDEAQMEQAGPTNDTSQQVVRVELRCSCQSNPPASIIWTDTESKPYTLTVGKPAHVLEEPKTETDGHTATSLLIIGYNLDPNWPHKDTSYICSASNKLGEAEMRFKVEQGDPPPAFNVAPQRIYTPENSMFRFTISSANFEPESASQQQQQAREIVPPVDSFRIRAESSGGGNEKADWQRARSRSPEASVQWPVPPTPNQLASLPQTFNVSLARLPAGNQRLFLEAHNAVGWSGNATYLGAYNIVSGAPSLQPLAGLLLAGTLLLAALLRSANREGTLKELP